MLGRAPERGQAAPPDGAPPDAAPVVGVPPAPGWHEPSRLAARPAPSGLVAPEGRLAARWALASREGDWARAGLGGAGAAREEAARPWPEALEVWGPQARPGTFEYVRAATSGPYPQFNRIGELGPMLRSDPYEPNCVGVTGRWHRCHSHFPATLPRVKLVARVEFRVRCRQFCLEVVHVIVEAFLDRRAHLFHSRSAR